MTQQTVYFPGLNALRFFSALAVFLDHFELVWERFGFEPWWPEKYSAFLGASGVTFFFVISGFLITYLLLAEKQQTKDISVQAFYIRRCLRIWPLYFIALILGFVILPAFAFFHIPGNEVLYDQFTLKVFLYAVFLPNVAFVFLSPVPYGFGLWSIGVEEQYYAVWPWLMRIKNIWRMIVTSLGIVLLIRVITGIMYINFPEESPWELLLEFLKRTRFSAMLIGAMGAYGLYRKKSFVKDLIFNKAIQFASLAVLAIFLTAPNGPPLYNTFKHEFVAIAALVIILNTAANPKSLIKLELRFLSWLGQVSYGFYIWHGVAVFVVIKAISLNFSSSGWLLHCFTLAMAFTITVVFSAISYNYLEKPFLKLKERFTVVPNRSAG